MHGKLVTNRIVPCISSKAMPVCSEPPLNCPQVSGTCDTQVPKLSCAETVGIFLGENRNAATTTMTTVSPTSPYLFISSPKMYSSGYTIMDTQPWAFLFRADIFKILLFCPLWNRPLLVPKSFCLMHLCGCVHICQVVACDRIRKVDDSQSTNRRSRKTRKS